MRKNIAVFFGGRSNEHEVSVITGMLAVNLLRGAGYRVMPVYLPKKGGMLIAENARGVDDFRRDRYEKFEEAILYKKSLINLRKPKRIKFSIDCALNCCHGGQGEDGTLSALLHWNGVLSVSPDTAVSAMFMDKSLSKIALRGLHIPVIEDLTVYEEKWETAREEVFAETKALGYPVIVKPCSLGSSIGIRVARDEKELADALALAFELDHGALIEKYLTDKRDINCAACVLNGKIIFSPLEEVFSSEDILSFSEKYEGTGERTSCIPAELDVDIADKIKAYLELVCKSFQVRGIVRADFIVSGEEVYFNELNTVPGSLALYLFGKTLTEGRDFLVRLIEEVCAEEEKSIVETNLLEGGIFGSPKGCKRR